MIRRERALKILLVAVGLFFSAAIHPAIGGIRDVAHSDTGDTMMMGIYRGLGNLSADRVPQPLGAPKSDCVRGLSSFAHAGRNVGSGVGDASRKQWISRRLGPAGCDWRSPDCARSKTTEIEGAASAG